MNSQLSAIIDLGTNTFHLLIANEKKEILHEEKRPVRMGVGGINKGTITEDGITRTLDCLIHFSKKCKEFDVQNIRAFGTSALRNAGNGQAVVQKIKEAAGIDVQIISGEEEARLIYQGVRQAVKMGSERCLIMDIGGGSVEFIIANENEIFWKHSFEVGGQRLLEKFHKHDPILKEELDALNEYLSTALSPLKTEISKYNPTTLIGSSGTFETLSDMYCTRKNIRNEQKPESPLSVEIIGEIYHALITRNKAERIALPGMMEWRAEMIVVTTTLVKFILDFHAFESIKVSRYSLKEGVLFS